MPGSIFCLSFVRGVGHHDIEEGDHDYDHAVVVTAETAPNFDTGAAAWTPDEGRTWFALPEVSGFWAVAFATPKAGWFVGNGGQILKILVQFADIVQRAPAKNVPFSKPVDSRLWSGRQTQECRHFRVLAIPGKSRGHTEVIGL